MAMTRTRRIMMAAITPARIGMDRESLCVAVEEIQLID
jgi:hypothetical protein